MMLLVLPLTFASSTFVKVSSMPGWLQAFVKVNPISQVVDAVRGLLLLPSHAQLPAGVTTASAVGWTFVWIAGILVVFFPLAMRAYVRRT
jgi:oleandomycin transport system permease protein